MSDFMVIGLFAVFAVLPIPITVLAQIRAHMNMNSTGASSDHERNKRRLTPLQRGVLVALIAAANIGAVLIGIVMERRFNMGGVQFLSIFIDAICALALVAFEEPATFPDQVLP